jgi:ubiquitin conjugation factor E4 A
LELSNALFTATCSWLVHLAALTDETENDERIEMIKELPITSKPHRQLSYIPEFVMENITNYLTFLGRFNVQLFEVKSLFKKNFFLYNFDIFKSLASVNEYVTLVLVFMGDASRLRNPHLRAALAEALEAILPNKQHGGGRTLNRFVASFDPIFANLFVVVFQFIRRNDFYRSSAN